ncbi:histidinol-phosphatase HisJ family protein [Vallitalea okinawensis]|uniref:histidinol-phosphatase HisJ family protein n=1 Tax=Vallitalea okinawensis TaxID=2078660 RepID=UPI000CFCA085|nr:histidinol-phosphatase HisJ family protein [Vallitalea okinawensis]
MLFDYHVHSDMSTDGKDSLNKLCERAITIGLKEFAITDHFEPTEKDSDYLFYNIEENYEKFKIAKEKYSPFLDLKFGIELGQPHRFPKRIKEILATCYYDYVLASSHKMDKDVDFGELDYTKIDINKYCKIYLEEIKNIIRWGDFDCIGHFDLPKRYAARAGVRIHLTEYMEELNEVLKLLVESGKGLEINSSGLRQHAKTCLPDLDILSMYRRLGGQILTIGSDAHSASELANGLSEAIEIAKLAGFRYITTFDKRKPLWIKISEAQQYHSFNYKFA